MREFEAKVYKWNKILTERDYDHYDEIRKKHKQKMNNLKEIKILMSN